MGSVTGFDNIFQAAAILKNASDEMVVAVCKQIQLTAQGTVAYDTGFLASSIYTETKDGSTYGVGMMEPPGDAYALEDIGPPENSHTGYVAVAANYGAYVEFGTRKMGAQPYLIPALELERAAFEGGDYLAKALETL